MDLFWEHGFHAASTTMAWKRRVLAPANEDKARPEGVVELPPGVVEWCGADTQPVGAQDPDRDAEQEQQFGLAAGAVGVDPDGVGGGGRGVDAGELAVGGEQQPVGAVGEVGEGVEAAKQGRGFGGR
jgi:hypothetical protein